MLKKIFRLQKKEDFDKVFQGGKPFFAENVACRALFRPKGSFRLGFSLSKKHLPRAVDRNRLRRLISALIAKEAESWPSCDLVFSTRKTPKVLTRESLSPEVSFLLALVRKKEGNIR